jgi:single-stranded DNA-binding protein
MSQQPDKLTHITGNVGDDPKTFDTSKGKVVKISIAVTMRYGEDGETRWVNGAIWDESLQEFALKEISKGTPVAAEGYLRTDREYNGKQQFDLNIRRIGLVKWAKRNGSSKRQQTEQPASSEELGW